MTEIILHQKKNFMRYKLYENLYDTNSFISISYVLSFQKILCYEYEMKETKKM